MELQCHANLFRFLTYFITFDIETTRIENLKSDRFAAFREFIELFNKQSMVNMAPEVYLSLDETLYPMRNQIAFKMHIPTKPSKYGLLFKSVNDARYPYTFACLPYCGKPDNVENAPYYIKGTENAVKSLVQFMQGFCNMDGRNITFDRLYTSIPLARWLLDQNITMLGTMQQNRLGIPAYLKEVVDKEPLNCEIFWESKEEILSLSSYTVSTKSKGKNNVLMLSTPDYTIRNNNR